MADNPADNKGNTSTSALSAGEKALIDRLKTEGDLLRNSGTNSIKSMNLKLEKFDNIFQSISNSLSEQTAILRETFNIQKAENVKKQITDVEKKAKDDSKTAAVSNDDLLKSLDKILKEKLGEDKEKPEGVFSRLGQGAKTAMNNAFWIAMAPALGQIASDLVEEAGKRMNLPQGAIDAFAKTADFATMFGTIGASFGAKWGARGAAMGAGVGAGVAFGDQVLDAAGIDKDQMVTILGQNIPVKTIAEDTFGVIGGAIGLTLSNPTVWKSVFSPGAEGTSKIAGFLGKASLSLAAAGAVASLYMAYGDDAKKWLGDEAGMSPEWADVTVDSFSAMAEGASLGAMFGPEGMIVGAIAGLAVGLGYKLYNWIQDNGKTYEKKLNDQLNYVKDAVESGKGVVNPELYQRLSANARYVISQGTVTDKAELTDYLMKRADGTAGVSKEDIATTIGLVTQEQNMRNDSGVTTNIQVAKPTGADIRKDIAGALTGYLTNSGLDSSSPDIKNEIDSWWSQSGYDYDSSITKDIKDSTIQYVLDSLGKNIETAASYNLTNKPETSIQSIDTGPRISKIQSASKPTALPPLTIVSPTYGGSTVNNYNGGATNSAINLIGGGGGSGVSDYFTSLYGMHRAAN